MSYQPENNKLVNAQAMARMYPGRFNAPTIDDLNRIRPGDNVKVCLNDERFWCKVIEVKGDTLYTRVNNDLVLNDLPYDTPLLVLKENVYDISNFPSLPRPKVDDPINLN